jgi:hypothetical protein
MGEYPTALFWQAFVGGDPYEPLAALVLKVRAEPETEFRRLKWPPGKLEAATMIKHRVSPKNRLVCPCRKQDHA